MELSCKRLKNKEIMGIWLKIEGAKAHGIVSKYSLIFNI